MRRKRKMFQCSGALEILLKKLSEVSEVSESDIVNYCLWKYASNINSFTDKNMVIEIKNIKDFKKIYLGENK